MVTSKYVVVVVLGALATTGGSTHTVRSQDKATSSRVVAEKSKITFDPKTCTEGRGVLYWGLGSSEVKILGQKDGYCVFEYTAEVEMGYAIYLVRVPVDSGPVTIEARSTSYLQVVTSFPLDKAKLLRRGAAGSWEVPVGDTGEFVFLGRTERRSEMEPRKGDKVKFRFIVHNSPEFKPTLSNGTLDPSVEFVVGAGDGWPWVETAMENMTVGDRRQVHVPLKIAEGALRWLPRPSDAKVLYLEMRLVSVERAK